MGFPQFALICIDFLAWPVIALGYPLFASMRAVETGSKKHMKKLVIYWTLFSLISLFEFAFVKIIQWIPFWSSIRLIAILWLVIPRFNGACCAYQSLVRPVLYVNIQAFIDKFYKPKEEKPSKRETFLDVVEKYIEENGSEALEMLIASKHECKECENSQRDSQVLEPEEKNAAVASKQPKEPDAAQHNNVSSEAREKTAATEAEENECKECENSQRDSQVLEPEEKNAAGAKQLKEIDAAQHNNVSSEATEKTAATEAEQVQYAQPNTAAAVAPNGKDAAGKDKETETTPQETSAGNRRPQTPPVKKADQEWRCDLCQVTATSKKMLNAHLQGRKHKSKCASLKSSKLGANDTVPSPSTTGNSSKVGEGSEQKSSEKTQEGVQSEAPTDQQKQAKQKQDGGAKNQMVEQYCRICDVKLVTDVQLASHINGRRHLKNIRKMVKIELEKYQKNGES